MGLSLGLQQTLRLSQGLFLKQSFGESCGDIPLYSLHKIRRLLRYSPPTGISGELLRILAVNLIRANAEYKKDSGNNWSCLTSNNLVDALASTEAVIDDTVATIDQVPSEQLVAASAVKELLTKRAEQAKAAIREWFSDNADRLDYDMSGQVPWAVVQRLRRGLAIWVSGIANPFNQGIEEMILEAAAEQGIAAGDAEEAWTQMGGKVFKPRTR